jgi:hypothetical protein
MPVVAAEQEIDRAGVVTKAVLRAAEALGLSARRLAQAIGTSEPTISRMRNAAYRLDPAGKSFELSVLLIRIFRSLDAIAGGDPAVVRGWMMSENSALGGRPIDRIGTVAGLVEVLAYLDARRAPL